VSGFTTGEFAAYYIILMLVNHLTFTWIMWEYDYRVRTGSLSFALLRPVHPIHADIADNVSYKLLTLVVMIPTAALLTLAFRPDWHWVPWAILALAPVLVTAFIVRFVVEWTLAMSAFWMTRITAINQGFFVIMLFLSGQIAPLELMPRPIQLVATLLPFRWVVSFPVELALGRLTPLDALLGFAAQLVWLGLSLLILRVVWRAGVRQYSAVGS
jgi:ABC-2 type transport system permease protein